MPLFNTWSRLSYFSTTLHWKSNLCHTEVGCNYRRSSFADKLYFDRSYPYSNTSLRRETGFSPNSGPTRRPPTGSKPSWPGPPWRRVGGRARQGMHALVEGESAHLAERQSLRWMWNEMEYEGHYFGDVPVGGYRRLVEAMAAGLDLRLGVDVAEIACSASGVRVRGADGAAEEGSHAVVTVPLGVLKRGAPRSGPHCHQIGWRRSSGSGSGATRRWPCGSTSHSGAPRASPTR